ncbi:interferon-induced protein 44-like [Mercenaria mercenaria]|uniref:interferon-induced protein 44-like n=1 Tax=Mercenaria mercenaria TaxID=6596 RepID=UPI00234F62A4|nr:interferon-induced protein 44-like [Mercenaria mercenaria]
MKYNQALLKEIANARFEGVETANLLLIGPQQAGKSSFINSIISIAKGRKSNKTAALGRGDSVTERLLTVSGQGLRRKLRFKDTVGIIEATHPDVTCDNIKQILVGDVKHREMLYQGSRSYEKIESTYGPSKTTAHCVIFVIDANVLNTYKENAHQGTIEFKIKNLMDKVKDMGIPFILVLTKIDQLCEEVENDISVTFRSVGVKEAVDTARRIFGFQEIDIYPVKNYEKETKMNPLMDMLILEAIRQAINYSVDYLEDLQEN